MRDGDMKRRGRAREMGIAAGNIGEDNGTIGGS